jgi:hypothetical protein
MAMGKLEEYRYTCIYKDIRMNIVGGYTVEIYIIWKSGRNTINMVKTFS